MDPPVQRPLAPQRVMLSPRVIAYYGLIRSLGTSRRLMFFARRAMVEVAGGRVPNLLSALFSPRAAVRTPGGGWIADCSFTTRWPSPSLHRLGIHIATRRFMGGR